LADDTERPGDEPAGPTPAASQLPPGHIFDQATGKPRPMTFMERAKQAAGAAASTAAKVSVDVGSQAAKAGADLGGRAAAATQATIKDPATKARARAALKKAKRGFTTVLERIDPRILADVVVKATSLQEKANLSLKERGSVYRISQIQIGAAIPPSIQFTIARVDEADAVGLTDSSTLLANAKSTALVGVSPTETIVSLDGAALEDDELDELEDAAD
jgi:hypothetical protein